ncbi:MAG: hypothetical protein NZ516_01045 [Raineya sp.]|nr:hypothetical protein [Raineya sp.]
MGLLPPDSLERAIGDEVVSSASLERVVGDEIVPSDSLEKELGGGVAPPLDLCGGWGVRLLFLLLLSCPSLAQERCKKIALTDKITDTLTILPNSFRFQSTDTSLKIIFDFSRNEAFWQSKQNYTAQDSIMVCYQVLPFTLHQKQQKRPSVDTLTFFIVPLTPITQQSLLKEREEIFSTDSIQKTGAIYRGIAVGNQQSAVTNSTLNLQLEGKLSSEISLKALITDQQVPFQPEGNTQQIQQLDKVLVELQSKTTTLQAGDIVMQNQPSEFLRFYKNVQGVQLENVQKYADSSQSKTTLGVALAKGRFASTAVTPIEGVQGPYRLRGANNERFIVIIANTEQVYVDGKLLRRGFDADYVIDYNLAEITFNPNILITQYTRIRIDYEYTERNYSRTNLKASHSQQWKNLEIFGQYYAETDNPRNPLTLRLTDEQKLQLSQIGDNLQQAFLSTADSVGFSQNAILYEKKDTLTASGLYEGIFVYSQNPQKAYWQVTFTEVGTNKGNYILKSTLQNGRIFQWVEPIGGIPQGNFEPLALIPLPQKRQMITTGLHFKPTEFEKISAEIAFSQRDLNRFSKIGDEDNNGTAFKILAQQKNRFRWGKYQLQKAISYEYNSPTFLPIDRFRPIEFNRDWNLNLDTLSLPDQKTEHIAHAEITLQKDAQNFVTTKHFYRNRNQTNEGFQHYLNFAQKLGNFSFKGDFFALNALQKQQTNLALWQRASVEVAHQSKKWQKGYAFNLDKNTLRKRENDSIFFTAMHFDEHKFFLQTADSLSTRFRTEYSYRTDNQPVAGKMQLRTIAQTFQSILQTKPSVKQNFKLQATYRNVQNYIFSNQSEENLMGRVEWQRNLWQRNIRSELVWQNVAARELRREFSFIQVPTGQGTHTWRDDNGNGIAELNEFYLALNPDERQYAKIFTPTDSYIKAFSTDFNYRLNVQMPTNWLSATGLKRILAQFSLNGSALIRRKTIEADFLKRIFPFSAIQDQNLLSAQENLRGILFFKRGNPDFGADVNFSSAKQKQLLTNGFETRQQQEVGFNFRKNLSKKWNFQWQNKHNQLRNASDFLLNRNFWIETWGFQPQFAYQPNQNLRVSVSNLQAFKNNLLGNEKTHQQEWSSEIRWSKPASFVFSAQIRWVNMDFRGETQSPVAYEMLEALQAGQNWVWTASYQQKLANGLQINFLYNGRKMPNTPRIIHFGQVQAGVLF